jgi:hypothetical protein
MFIYVALLITLALAGCAIFLSFRPRPSARLLSLALAAFVYLYGTWVFLSVWGRYAFGFWMIGGIGMWIASKECHGQKMAGWAPDCHRPAICAMRPLFHWYEGAALWYS